MEDNICECGCGERTKVAAATNKRYGWVKGVPFRFIHGHQGRGAFDLRVRLMERMQENDVTGCWEWLGNLNSHGYGTIMIEGRIVRAHRLSYEVFSDEKAGSHFVCHECDNPKCINPRHLWLGSHQENLDDASQKLRMHFGESHGLAKLTDEKVREIRLSKEKGVVLAKKFGVSPACISTAKNGKSWPHIKSV